MFGVIDFCGDCVFIGEGGEPVVREEAEAVWDWWSFATKEGCSQICEMATSCEDSEEEEDPQATFEGPTSIEPVHQDS